jgi:hypothetical protein
MKCYKCDKKAIGRLSPDLDIKGIPFCKEHKEFIMMAYMVLITEGEDSFKKIIK